MKENVYVISIMCKGQKLYFSHASYNPYGNPILHFTNNILSGVSFAKTKRECSCLYKEIKNRHENFNRSNYTPYYDIIIFESDIDTLQIEKFAITIDVVK